MSSGRCRETAVAVEAMTEDDEKLHAESKWVEIIEPRTGEHMFANLTTGECLWDPPSGVPVKKTNDNQWWELFDLNTSRFYYYNASNQKTVWQRPSNCDIIPLAKLQTLKQNTEVKSTEAKLKKTESKAVQVSKSPLKKLEQISSSKTKTSISTLTQTSPLDSPKIRRRHNHRHHHHHHHHHPSPLPSSKNRLQPEELSPLEQQRRRTTIGPSHSKYYNNHYQVPVSKQRSLEGENFRALIQRQSSSSSSPVRQHQQQQQQESCTSPSSSSISRSVSFMVRNNDSWQRMSFESNNSRRRSIESTPHSARRFSKTSPESKRYATTGNSGNGSPIDGYCTPMINRKHNDMKSSQQQSPTASATAAVAAICDRLSLSELVDSGLSTLTDGKVVNKDRQNNGMNSSNNRMSPLQKYILEQAKLSGYRFGDPVRSALDIESEDDFTDHHNDDDENSEGDFADDEEGGSEMEDEIISTSHASSSVGDEEEDEDWYLSEPTYNNLEWMRGHSSDIDAFSEEFDHRMHFGVGGIGQPQPLPPLPPVPPPPAASSTIPRPISHSSDTHRHYRQHHHHQQQPRHPHHQQQQQQNSQFPIPYEVLQSASLQRHPVSVGAGGDHSLSRNASSSTANCQTRNLGSSVLSVSTSIHSTISCESDIERYAADNLNVQKKGIFRRKMTVKDILSWTAEGIGKPLTCLSEKTAKKEAIEVFRLTQIYMGDRKAKQGMTINNVALDITSSGYGKPALRDEIYVQLCKQTTENPRKESLRRGWELMAICLAFFPPSTTFSHCLASYILKHRDPALDDFSDVGKWPIHVQISHYAGICAKRLDRIGESGHLGCRKPTIEDIDQSRLQIFRPSMFGGTLEETLEMQKDRFPGKKLPWILTTLADQVIQLNGTTTEGIFRVPADMEEVNNLKSRFDQWEVPICVDCHTAASLLKLWFRELYEPLIPDAFYEEAVSVGNDPERVKDLIRRLPDLNRTVLIYLVRFLQTFAQPDVVHLTKMDDSNLGTVFAPNILRCPSSDPSTILENTRKEMAFVKTLIQSYDTSAKSF